MFLLNAHLSKRKVEKKGRNEQRCRREVELTRQSILLVLICNKCNITWTLRGSYGYILHAYIIWIYKWMSLSYICIIHNEQWTKFKQYKMGGFKRGFNMWKYFLKYVLKIWSIFNWALFLKKKPGLDINTFIILKSIKHI